MNDSTRRRSRRHPNRWHCRGRSPGYWYRADLLRYTREFPLESLHRRRSDYSIRCRISQDWLIHSCRRLRVSDQRRWQS